MYLSIYLSNLSISINLYIYISVYLYISIYLHIIFQISNTAQICGKWRAESLWVSQRSRWSFPGPSDKQLRQEHHSDIGKIRKILRKTTGTIAFSNIFFWSSWHYHKSWSDILLFEFTPNTACSSACVSLTSPLSLINYI